MKIKNYKLFLESNNFDFDFLANIGKMKQAIIKIVQLHEKKCYGDIKLSSYERFKASLNDLIDSAVKGEYTITEDYLSVINLFEKEVYGKDLLSSYEESIFSHLDDLISCFNSLLDNEEKDEEDIMRLGKDADHILNKMDETWIYTSDESNVSISDIDISDIDDAIAGLDDRLSKETDDMWTSEEEFEKDIESYIGKKMDDFDYSDKLQAYQYIENKEWVKNILEGGSEKDKDFVTNFLSQMKDMFGI
jgi:hypothetical protein